jgi:hypothetical protein
MKYLLFFFISIGCYKRHYGQNLKNDSAINCSAILDDISDRWKIDSLASDGFRLSKYKVLQNCKLDKIYRGLLLDKLGTPNQIWKTGEGMEYIYYYTVKRRSLSPENLLFECFYISFKFGIYDRYSSAVVEGSLDIEKVN